MSSYVTCALCGSDSSVVIAAKPRRELPHATKVKCLRCGLIYSQPMADENELSHYYTHYYADSHHAPYLTGEADESNLRASRAKVLEIMRHKKEGRFLDVGCGVGYVLNCARDLGFEVKGVEPDPQAAQRGRMTFGLDIECGTLDSVSLPSGAFDVVYTWHVIEHVRELRAYVRNLRRLVTDSGVILVGTDNHDAQAYRLYRWMHHLRGRVPPIYDGYEHTFGFTKLTLTRLLTECGLQVREIRAFKVPYSGPLRGLPLAKLGKEMVRSNSALYLEAYASPKSP